MILAPTGLGFIPVKEGMESDVADLCYQGTELVIAFLSLLEAGVRHGRGFSLSS